MKISRLSLCGALAGAVASVSLAQVAPPPDQTSDDNGLITLSPFVISGEQDSGYIASDTLAGTRLRTPLKDVAASISVVTKDFLNDIAATSAADLLVYTTGTEVVGVGGNFSGSAATTYSQEYEPQREDASPQTRLRGLASADETRNFFSAAPHVPFDSYNTQSVTINRGANAILFGFGSPAGIVENTLETANFKNTGEVQLRVGSFGTRRESIDLNRVLLKDKLAIRVAALDESRKYEQDFAHRDQERIYGAITFKPFKSSTFRVNAEHGHLDQALPRLDPPLDWMSSWWQFGQPARDTQIYSGNMPNGVPVTTYLRNNNLDGLAGNWSQNAGLIYDSANATTPSDAFVGYVSLANGVRYRHLGPRSTKEVALFVPGYIDPLAGFQVSKQITDRSIFDYRKESLDGPNDNTSLDFDTVNGTFEQLFLNGDAGFEIAYDHQESTQGVHRLMSGYRGNSIYIEVNKTTTDGRPNPNFGRPFISASGYFNQDRNTLDSGRATAFLKHDFSRQMGLFGRILGVQNLTGMYTQFYRDQVYMSGNDAETDVGFNTGLGGHSLADRSVSPVFYIGPSLANASSPSGANLHGLQNTIVYPDSVTVWVANAGTGNKWVQQTWPIYQYPDYAHLASNVVNNHYRAISSAEVWQGNWFHNLFVSTLGWRHDEVRNSSSPNTSIDPATGAQSLTPNPRVPGQENKNDSFSYGLALHVPSQWFERLPGAPLLSLYYNKSENFQITGVRTNVLGDAIAPQSGDTKEIGVGLSAWDNRVSLRVAWYETVQDSMTDARLQQALGRIGVLEDSIYGNIPKATLDSIGYMGVDSSNLSPLFAKYVAAHRFNVGPVRADGTRDLTYSAPTGEADVTSSISKGIEIEGVFNATKNWRLAFNLAKQQAVQGDTSAVFAALLDERLQQWHNPLLWGQTIGAWNVQSYAETNLINPLNTAKLSTGQYMPELREWRANFISNYSFPREGFLKGWGIGGALRWQDRVATGYPVISDPTLGLITDVNHPFWGPSQTTWDGWLSYQRKLWHNINWKLQLNVRNIFNDNLLVPVVANPVTVGDLKTHDNVAWRVGAGRTWELTSTFSF
ncbi:MAG TPA: TonB-dependent receptor plug domain-containing protein [Opitutaceae bacterium]|nr:TonB-dependent receptor plug domain-containing protein [Opitutaceae bacterium]